MLKTTGKGPEGTEPSATLNWAAECQKVLENLIALFTTEQVLKNPDKRYKIIIQVDASDVTMAAVMLQEGERGPLHLCAFVSERFTASG